MSQRDDIINRINKASSLVEQATLVSELDAYDRNQREAVASGRSIDLTDTIVRETLSPVAVHERSTIATDWLGTVEASNEGGEHEITVEASMWYRRLSPEVRGDDDEFSEQARGMARRTASAYGEQAQGLEKQFLEYVSFLRSREAASGLPQVQQLVDSQENPAQTPLDTQTFDNFAPEVAPINQGVSGTESSERAPLLQEIEGEGGGQGQAEVPNHHDTAPQITWDGITPTSSLVDTPTLSISHFATLDDYREGGRFEVTASSAGNCPSCGSDNTWQNKGGGCACGECGHDWDPNRHEAASGLDQVEQTVDPHEVPKPTPLPTDVAYPWTLDENLDEGSEDRAKTAAFQRRAAYVAGLTTRDPASLTDIERKEVLAFTATLQKRADEWSQSGPQSHGPDAANSPFTTPEGTSGTFSQGYAEGRSDWPNEAPTYADDSSSVPDFVRGHSEGYGDAARENPVPGAAQPGDLPRGAGNPEAVTHASSLQTTAAKAPLQVSAAFTSPVEQADPDFTKAYRYATKWKPTTRLVTTGSASFEAGLYAGISDNPEHQDAWGNAHRVAARKFQNPGFLKRMSMHRSFTKKAAKRLDGFTVEGNYLRSQAATSSDLDTMVPGASPSPTGQTPINGPGTPPPLAGGADPAAPGGPSPYNGAEPFGAGVVPSGVNPGTPTAISDAPGSAVDKAAMERLSPQTLAFRKTVQANLLKQRTDKN